MVKLLVAVPPVSGLPPLALANQSMIAPTLAPAVMLTVPVPHTDPPILVSTVGIALMVAVTGVRVWETHPVDVVRVSA